MKTNFSSAGAIGTSSPGIISDAERMETMKELLADLRVSIQAQRHLIDVSRELLERS